METSTVSAFDAIERDLAAGASISIIALVDALIAEAYQKRASDIHIDPRESNVRVRLRVDGLLSDCFVIDKKIHTEVISRIKILAGMRTDEHQATQDGRFRHVLADVWSLDIRVSIAPTYHGEKIVLRLLSARAADNSLEMLGFSESDCKKINEALQRPSGMILSTGPTGSGKTTTLYTLIKKVNTESVSIVTIEDPIEYAVENIEQIQVNARAGLTFANGLRSILRQDPNIIMVGEIRDVETAAIAVNTALTGHLLLSTLHTNDAATTLPRLLDMGIDPYLVSSTITLAIGQRLVRKICSMCKREVTLTEAAQETLSALPLTVPLSAGEVFYNGSGCGVCNGTGFYGRLCISEVLVATLSIREAIMRKASAAEIRTLAVQEGMTTMLEDGFAKARKGYTTIEEILRVVHE